MNLFLRSPLFIYTAAIILSLINSGVSSAQTLYAPAPLPPRKVRPKLPDANVIYEGFGLSQKAALAPRRLARLNVDVEIINPKEINTRTNVVRMTEHTQISLFFDAAKNKEYRLECAVTGRPQFLILTQTQENRLQHQQTVGASSGRVVTIIDPKPTNRKLRIFMQANQSTDWKGCLLGPT